MAILSVTSSDAQLGTTQKGCSGAQGHSASAHQQRSFSRARCPRSSPMPLADMLPGMHEDFSKSGLGGVSPEMTASPSPVAKTPISRAVRASSLSRPPVMQVNKLPLREFQEFDQCQNSNRDLRSISNSSTPMPTFRPRSSSAVSLSGSSSGNTTRPCSRSREDGEALFSGDTVRPLSRHELHDQNRDAVNWFRASHAINFQSRSREETEALLAAARCRRSSGVVKRRQPKVEKVHDLDEDTTLESASKACSAPTPSQEPQQEAPETRRRSVLDPMLLWGAKPPAASTKQQKAPKTAEKRSHSLSGEGVTIGDTSFLTRLRKRAGTVE